MSYRYREYNDDDRRKLPSGAITSPSGEFLGWAANTEAGELIAKALNRLPGTEEAFRNERLAERRRLNNSPDGETT